jgi:hypothetical protein
MDLTLILEGCILVVSAVLVGIAIYKSRKAGQKDIPWDAIRPILTETFLRIKEVQDLKKVGYQAMEDYAVLLVREQIRRAGFLSDTEKALISDDLIRSIIGPRLKEIYDDRNNGK